MPTGPSFPRLIRATDARVADVSREAPRRLQLVALVIASVVALNLVLFSAVPALGGPRWGDPAGAIDLVVLGMLVLSLAVYGVARSGRLEPRRLLDLGLMYEVSLAFLGGVALQYFASTLRIPQWGVSEICVLILVFPVIVPNTFGKTLVASLLAASMDPLGDLLYSLKGAAVPTLDRMFAAYYLNYVCALLALIPSAVVRRLGQQVEEASRLGSYRLVERLGAGGMGEVWRAEHHLLARPAAIKLVRADRMSSPETSDLLERRFEREAQATAALRSPHTVALYDFGVTEDHRFYYVMELLDGVDFDRLINRFGPVPAERAVHLLVQACDSLREAHHAGLVHRDIKPSNLVACRYGIEVDFVKLLDFGLVRASPDGRSEALSLTGEGSPGGTPAYMAPEQVMGGSEVDARTDLYALGCVAYWLLTGLSVFEGTTPVEIMVHHAKSDPDPPSARVDFAIPPDLEATILACLDKDPARRPPTAEALAERLSACRIETRWTEARAREWWDTHLPLDPGRGGAPEGALAAGVEAGLRAP